MRKLLIVLLLMLLCTAGWLYRDRLFHAYDDTAYRVVNQDSVLAQIRELNRLESTAFYFDTVIRTEKQGNWYALWQDSEKGIFVVKGNAVAGIDLKRLTENQVSVLSDRIIIQLPPVQVLSVQLEHIEVYDWRTGTFNILKADPAVLNTVQTQAKQQLLQQACANGILQHARELSREQIKNLFALTQIPVSVYSGAAEECRMPVR